MANLYLYLLKTDSKGIKLLTIFRNKTDYQAVKVDNITNLHLPQSFAKKLQLAINQHSSQYNTWIESASNFEDLKTKLTKRGVTGIYYSNPLYPFEYESTYNDTAPDLKKIRPSYATMVQKITSS